MKVYIGIAIIILLFSFVEVFQTRQNGRQANSTRYVYLFICLFLILFTGLRACGFDYYNYKGHYVACHSHIWKTQSEALLVEPSFGMMAYLAPSYNFLLFAIALVSLGILFEFVLKESTYPIFSIYLLLGLCFYSTYMGQIRQGISLALVLLSFVQKSKTKSFLLIGVACLFHISSLLAFIQFAVPKKKLDWRVYIFFLLLALIMNLTVGEIILPIVSNYSGMIASKLYIYAVEEANSTLGLNTAMLLRLVMFYIFFRYSKIEEGSNKDTYILNLYFMSLLIYLGLGFIPQLAGRGALYFNSLEIILAAKTVTNAPNLRSKFVVYFFFVLVSSYRQISLFTSDLGQEYFVPYTSCLNLF